MRPSAIHTSENFPKMFHIFYLAEYSKVSTFFWDTRYKENNKKISDTFDHNFKNNHWHVMSEVSF